jgi:hypothetical protein
VHRSLQIKKSRGQDDEGGKHTLRITPPTAALPGASGAAPSTPAPTAEGLQVFRRVQARPRGQLAQPTSSEFTGQTWEELRDFGWINAIHPDDRERVRKLWEAARAAKTLYKSDGRLW